MTVLSVPKSTPTTLIFDAYRLIVVCASWVVGDVKTIVFERLHSCVSLDEVKK